MYWARSTEHSFFMPEISPGWSISYSQRETSKELPHDTNAAGLSPPLKGLSFGSLEGLSNGALPKLLLLYAQLGPDR